MKTKHPQNEDAPFIPHRRAKGGRPHGACRTSWFRARASCLILLSGFFGAVGAASAAITVDAGNVVRERPEGLGGTCAKSKFWEVAATPFDNDMTRCNVGMVRIPAYPEDNQKNDADPGTVALMDLRVAQILNAGAQPLFIQSIETQSTKFLEALLDINGNPYGAGSTATPFTRVSTNVAYLVDRYRKPPFNLAVQYWEIGNEPDDPKMTYPVASPQEYVDFFHAVHARLEENSLRTNVKLCGPAVSWDYGFGSPRDPITNAFLTACKNEVDVVTRHVYGLIYDWEGIASTPYNQLNSNAEMLHFDTSFSTTRGERALQERMNAAGVPSTVKTGITEMNMFTGSTAATTYNHTITQGLWFLIADHFTTYNPRMELVNGFAFDRVGDGFGYYRDAQTPSYPFWAAYMHGALGGKQVLAQTSSNPRLLVTATKDDSYVYVRVINRNTADITDSVAVSNAPVTGSPELFRLSATQTPNTGTALSVGTSFNYTFPAMTASIFRYRRSDAPTPPTAPPAPTVVHLDTSFDAVPPGMLTYTNNAAFMPAVAGGNLQLTTTTSNLATAVVFTGDPLPAAKSRVQVRFGFNVPQNYAEGFVFGAYSANPGAPGNPAGGMGYAGQNNRIWGVKVDNSPDQIGIVGSEVDENVNGWASQLLTYSNQNMYMIIDYDGGARTVRARLYEGTSEAGVLKADITNRVGNPASLPYGTVFGFAGATASFSQNTYIHGLRILVDQPSTSFVTGQVLTTGTQNNYQGWLGCRFTVGSSPLTITEVGRWVLAGNTGSHVVKVVKASDGTDVAGASATVETQGAPAGAFRYAPLAQPVVLAANTAYYLVSREPAGGDFYFNWRNVLQHTSRATVNAAAFGPGNGTWTTYGTAGNCYVPVSFRYQP